MIKKVLYSILFIGGLASTLCAQEQLGLAEMVSLAKENNGQLLSEKTRWQRAISLKKTAWDMGKTELYVSRDENNLAPNDRPLQVWGVQQSFEFPTVYFKRYNLRGREADLEKAAYTNAEIKLERTLTIKYYSYQTVCEKVHIYEQIDSIYSNFAKSATRKFELGETNYLEKITAAAKQKQVQLQLQQMRMERQNLVDEIHSLVQSPKAFEINNEPPHKLTLSVPTMQELKGVNLYKQRELIARNELGLESHKTLPDFSLNFFYGTNPGLTRKYTGFQIGVQIPLLFGSDIGRIQAARKQVMSTQYESHNQDILLAMHYGNLHQDLEQAERALSYYETEGNKLSNEILKTAQLSFKQGEIDYFQYIQSLENAYQLMIEYMQLLDHYNQTLIKLHFMTYDD